MREIPMKFTNIAATFAHPMTRSLCLGAILLSLSTFSPHATAAPATRVSAALWGNGEIYDTILTDTNFRQVPPQSTDLLYNFAMSGLEGQRAVAEAAPGDPDYNGGRWTVLLVVFTEQGIAAHDPDEDGVVNFELTSEEEVLFHQSLGHLEIMDAGVYFEGPMLHHNE